MPVITRRTASQCQGMDEPSNGKGIRVSKEFLSITSEKRISDGLLPCTPAKRRKRSQDKSVPKVTPDVPILESSSPSSSRTSSRKKLLLETPPNHDVPPSPKDWEDIYSLVEELRSDRSAPVDTNGSEALPQRHLGEKVFRFQVLIALMLSSQTKDAVVGDTIRSLQKHGLTVENILATSAETLNNLIIKVGFHNNKTKYIQQVVRILSEEYNGDIPCTVQDIIKLPGVGPKMAYIVENVAWGKSSGIGVDTHMHRMFNELQWVKSKNPEQTRVQLEAWLPRDKWLSVNILWVGFGQEVQQFKPKLLRKALDCSRPLDALRLIKRLGLDYKKEAVKAGLEDKLKEVLESKEIMKFERQDNS
jgi:endonuclease III